MLSILVALSFLATDALADTTLSLLTTETLLVQNKSLGTFTIPAEYSLIFDIKPTAIVSTWSSIFHATSTGTDCCALGSRMPAIYLNPGTTSPHIRLSCETNGNWGFASTGALPLNAWTTIEIRTVGQLVKIFYNSTLQTSATAPSDRISGSAKIYVSDPWSSASKASIRNVKLVKQDDCTIVKYAWAAMGKPDVAATTDCCTMDGIICGGPSSVYQM